MAKTQPVLEAYHETNSILSKLKESQRFNVPGLQFLQDRLGELAKLVPENFVALYEPDQYEHLVRYLKALAIRGRRAFVNLEKDRAKADKVKVYTNPLNELVKELSPSASAEKRKALEEFFWMIEEYKVSLFAQELKTSTPVSPKRLDNKRKEVERMV